MIKIIVHIQSFLYWFFPFSLLQRYIFKSIFPYFLMGVLIFSLVNFIQYLSEFIALALQYQASLTSVLKTVGYLIPFLMTFTIPIGVLIGIILAVGQMNQHSEIIAMRSNGLSLWKIIKPALFFGFAIFIFQLAFFQWILPWGNTNFLKEKYKMLQKNPLSQIQKQQSFSDGVRELKISGINEQTLYGVSFIDTQTNILYYSKTGSISPSIDEKNFNIPITLINATAVPYIFDAPSTKIDMQFFDKITVYIKAASIKSVVPEGSDVIGLTEVYHSIQKVMKKNTLFAIQAYHKMLRDNIKIIENQQNMEQLSSEQQEYVLKKNQVLQSQLHINTNTFQALDFRIHNVEDIYLLHRKLAFAVNSILMIIVGIPLSLFKRRQGKDIALGISILCMFSFNALLAASNFAFKQNILNAHNAAWFPSIFIFITGMSLLILRYKKI